MRHLLVFLCALALCGDTLAARAPVIVASIKPLHSLVQGVAGDTAKALLLTSNTASPHSFTLAPSQVKTLHEADVIFYIDDTFETFLSGVFETLPESVRKVAVTEQAQLNFLARRMGGAWEAHAHESHAHESQAHESHAHESQAHESHAHESHAHESHAHESHAHESRAHESHAHESHAHESRAHESRAHESHAHEKQPSHGRSFDAHVWLDADNAGKIVTAVADALAAAYPGNRDTYERNARALTARIKAMDDRLRKRLVGVKDKPFIVFHDAYQYFEHRYGLTGVGSITLEPHEPPSISRIREIREKARETGTVCIFSEPQFSDKLVNTVTQGSSVRRGTLDPLGAELENGPDLYFNLLENLAESFTRCLGGA